ncbi:MAG: RpiB/LacA/LacB family sugar-phosphate isomerase, partial [Chloroflexi bacterium]|nr:RpiB/LacA/LacB family sugar-phosphate isomerase [Chloroflexota bacterium]
HNDANILCMGGSVIESGPALEVVRAYLEAQFEGGRHARRVEKIASVENLGNRERQSPSPSR